MDSALYPIIDPERIDALLARSVGTDAARFREVLARAMEMKGLPPEDAASLAVVDDPVLARRAFRCGKKGQGNDLRETTRHIRTSLHFQPLRE